MQLTSLILIGISLSLLCSCAKQAEEKRAKTSQPSELLRAEPWSNTKLYELTISEKSPKELKDYVERTKDPDYKQTEEDRAIFKKYAVLKQPEVEPDR